MDWEQDDKGNIKLYPVSGWDSFTPAGMACGLRVHYVESEQDLLNGKFQALPLVLTPSQAREIGLKLIELADRIESPLSDSSAIQ